MSNCTKNVVLATNQNNGSFGGEGVFDCFYHSPPTYLQWVKATLLRKLWWPKCHLVQLTPQLTLCPISSIQTQLSMNGNQKYSHATANHISKRKCPILHLSVALQQQAAAAGVGFCQHTQIAYVFASDVRQGDRGKQGKSKKESLPMSASFPYGIFCHVTESQPQSPDKKQYIGAEQFWLYGAPLLLVQPQPPANEPLCRFFREMCVALFCRCFPQDALT